MPQERRTHLGLRRLRRAVFPEPAERHHRRGGARVGEGRGFVHGQRRPQLSLEVVDGELEARRHHPDDGVRLAVETQRAADHARVGGEAALPQPVAQQHHPRCARRRVGRLERAAELRPDAQKREGVARDPVPLRALRRDFAREAHAPVAVRGHPLEGRRLRRERHERRERHAEALPVPRLVPRAQQADPARVFVSER
jgi:hypothetical protein